MKAVMLGMYQNTHIGAQPKQLLSRFDQFQIIGTYGEFETIENVSYECQQHLQKIKAQYQQKQVKCDSMAKIINDLEGQLLNKLQVGKNKFFKLLEQHFESLEMEIKQKSSFCKQKCSKQIMSEKENIKKMLEDIDYMIKKLQGKNNLKQIITLMGSPYFEECENYGAQIEQEMNLLSSDMLDVITDESKLYSINIELAKYITIKNAAQSLIQKQQEKIFSYQNELQLINNRNQTSLIPLVESQFDNQPYYQINQNQLIPNEIIKDNTVQSKQKELSDGKRYLSNKERPFIEQNYTRSNQKYYYPYQDTQNTEFNLFPKY